MKAFPVKILPKKNGLFGFSILSDDLKIFFIYETYFKKLQLLVLEQLNRFTDPNCLPSVVKGILA